MLTLPGKVWSYFLGATVGHGQRPGRALLWLLAVLALGAILFWNAAPGDLTAFPQGGHVPPFHPVAYVLDVLLPVVDLGQERFWIPNSRWPWGWLRFGWFLGAPIGGWILTAVGVAGATGLLRRE